MIYNQIVNEAFRNYDELRTRFEKIVEEAVKTFGDDDLKKECEHKFVAKLEELVSKSTARNTTDLLMTNITLAKKDIINDIKSKSRQEMSDTSRQTENETSPPVFSRVQVLKSIELEDDAAPTNRLQKHVAAPESRLRRHERADCGDMTPRQRTDCGDLSPRHKTKK